MKTNCKRYILQFICIVFIGVVLGVIGPGYVGGLYYTFCGNHPDEQAYLDKCLVHIRDMRAACDDPDLQGILDYTIRRYNKVGPWDVMFFPLTVIPRLGERVAGCNDPFCPGITIDPYLFLDPPEYTALVIIHEAMHDYWPYYGHAHITPREKKFYSLSWRVQFEKQMKKRYPPE